MRLVARHQAIAHWEHSKAPRRHVISLDLVIKSIVHVEVVLRGVNRTATEEVLVVRHHLLFDRRRNDLLRGRLAHATSLHACVSCH